MGQVRFAMAFVAQPLAARQLMRRKYLGLLSSWSLYVSTWINTLRRGSSKIPEHLERRVGIVTEDIFHAFETSYKTAKIPWWSLFKRQMAPIVWREMR